MEAEGRLFPVFKEMGDTESLCAQESHGALLSIRTLFIKLSLVTHLKVKCFRYSLGITM